MLTKEIRLPFLVRASLFVVGVYALFSILYITRSLILPLLFATIIAILLQPIVVILVKYRINRVVAIIITLLLTVIILVSLGSLLISQMVRLSDSWPILVEKFNGTLDQTVVWASEYFDVKPDTILAWIAKAKSEIINAVSQSIGRTLVVIGNGIVIIFLLPVYIFLILYYQPLIIDFIEQLTDKGNKSRVMTVVKKTKTLIQQYLVGLLIETFIVAILEITVLLIFGIQYAILLGILGAMLNLIPYIGGVVAVALPMIVALATKDSSLFAIYILIFYYIIQLIDNNYIVPKIVASKVKINALFSIIVVLASNALWGVPGMFLSIPLLAIIKLIFDNVEPLKPWGFLLGDTMPNLLKIKPIIQKLIKK